MPNAESVTSKEVSSMDVLRNAAGIDEHWLAAHRNDAPVLHAALTELRRDARAVLDQALAKTSDERSAVICLGGWAGGTTTAVKVVGETPKKYRIKAIERTKLAGRDRWIEKDQTALVPKYAVRFT